MPSSTRFPFWLSYRGRLALLLAVVLASCFTVATLPASASAAFGIQSSAGSLLNADGSPDTQAGSHPFALSTSLAFDSHPVGGELVPDDNVKDIRADLPPGLVGNPTVAPRCNLVDLIGDTGRGIANCPTPAQVGYLTVQFGGGGPSPFTAPVYNLVPVRGEPARLGANVVNHLIFFETAVRSGGDYGLITSLRDISTDGPVVSSTLTLWGIPADPAHDPMRGANCNGDISDPANCSGGGNSVGFAPRPFLTLPTSCTGPLATALSVDSWQSPGRTNADGSPDLSDPAWKTASFLFTHDGSGEPLDVDGCNRLPFDPRIAAEPTSNAATSPTGLGFDLSFADEGLLNPQGLAQSQLKKAVVTLPQGFTTNPSVAAGLKACSQAEYESASVEVGTGCTPESKIGDVEITSPLVEPNQVLTGGLYVATQHDNPYGNLLTLYLIAREPEIGVIVKQALKVTPDPLTGQLTTEVDNVPQLPFSHFHLSFRQGQRSPLITPPACGTYTVHADLYPWSEPNTPHPENKSFQITQGPEGQPCPSGGVPPFHPGLEAGTQNNAAGTYSPFYTHITRKDSEQEITHFSIKLPPGLEGKLAGVPYCPDAAIAAAKAREKEGGGTEEEKAPSCPAASEVGHTLVGTGVGNVLAYAPGKLYLAGPYKGADLSIASITAAKVGPFDLGTVVVREGLKVDPTTAQVIVDAAGSDPIPHIVDGIPVHLRDIRIYVDKPNFTLNPTSCAKFSTASTVLGSGLDFVSEADDVPVTVTSPFQAADCASLGFKPKLKLSYSGQTKRSGFPALKAVLTYPKSGAYANIAKSSVTLPKGVFIANAHINNPCTRVQFNEHACPKSSILGQARVWSPLLGAPLEGPAYFRSNGGERELPDLAIELNGQIHIVLVGFIDSVGKKGAEVSRVRTRFQNVPDAPVSRFELKLLGGKRGLLENSSNLCRDRAPANLDLSGQNGKIYNTEAKVPAKCGGKKGGKKKGRHG